MGDIINSCEYSGDDLWVRRIFIKDVLYFSFSGSALLYLIFFSSD
ncbi:hypothetical protein F902_03304 [Acinetobacter higginsii]|uniref:Uncharacterized protein n=1 Tax=Acinetobacter higginsii TaxID=70347 RepID=N9SX80_9GAMM|nr:hypothetical protein F902_03304 [Acinetobacter higginsii]